MTARLTLVDPTTPDARALPDRYDEPRRAAVLTEARAAARENRCPVFLVDPRGKYLVGIYPKEKS